MTNVNAAVPADNEFDELDDEPLLTNALDIAWGAVWRDRLFDQGWKPDGHSVASMGRIGPTDANDAAVSAGRLLRVWTEAGSHDDLEIRFPTFSSDQWVRVVDLLTDSAATVAALLAGQLPAAAVNALRSAGLELIPTAEELTEACGCRPEPGCTHASNLMRRAFYEANRDPFVFFTLRGRPGEDLLEDLRNHYLPDVATRADENRTSAQLVGMARSDLVGRQAAPLPALPSPWPDPGQADRWSSAADLPDLDPSILNELAEDAITRAWAMNRGDAGSSLDLGRDADLARRAFELLGSTRIVELSRGIDESSQFVIGLATAWQAAGHRGLALLEEPRWSPEAFVMNEARDALIASGRRESSIEIDQNVVTVAGRYQFRLSRDEVWYRLDKRAGHWLLMHEPSREIDVVVASLPHR